MADNIAKKREEFKADKTAGKKIRQGFDKPCRLKVRILLFFYQVCKGCHTCIAGVVA